MSDTTASSELISNIPYWVKGTVDSITVTIPFLTAGDVDSYMDMLLWATRKMKARVDVKVFAEDKEVGFINSEVTSH